MLRQSGKDTGPVGGTERLLGSNPEAKIKTGDLKMSSLTWVTFSRGKSCYLCHYSPKLFLSKYGRKKVSDSTEPQAEDGSFHP